MEICLSCGSIAPTQSQTCKRCGSSFEDNRGSSGHLAEGLNWIRFDGYFLCRSCGFNIQLNYLDSDGAVLCSQCGVDQKFSWERWEQLLIHAHNVADLCGVNAPEKDSLLWQAMKEVDGQNLTNVYGKIGKTHSLVSLSQSELFEGFKYEFNVSPGFPLCNKCKCPLEAEIIQGGIRTQCPQCQEKNTYVLPQEASRYDSLKGVIAPEHLDGLDFVQIEKADVSGAVALTCPRCAGNIKQPAKEGFITCEYCGTSLYIPAHLSKKTSTQQPPRPWWILFEGKSRIRNKLEEKVGWLKRKKEAARKREEQIAIPEKGRINVTPKKGLGGRIGGFIAGLFNKHPVILILSFIIGINVLFFIPKVLGFIFGAACLFVPIFFGLFKKWKSKDVFGTTAMGIRMGIYLWCGLMFAAVGTIGIPQAVTYTAKLTAPLVCPEGYRQSVEAKIVTTSGNTSDGYTVNTSMRPICVGGMGKTPANSLLVLALITGFYMIFTLPLLLIEYIRATIRLNRLKDKKD